MDRRNYDPRALAVFDIVGSYFVDVVYNNHYLLAKEAVKSGSATNVTDAFRANIMSYMNGLSKRDDLFKKVVYQLHEFYQRNSGFGAIVLSEFQDKILSKFIPPEYYRDFAERHKDNALREIIVSSINEFGEFVVGRQALRRIIDNHMNRANVDFLQDHIVDIFIMQREEYYSKFAREISKQNAGDSVTKETGRKLKVAYLTEKKKCISLTEDNERAISIIKQLTQKISHLSESLDTQKRCVARLEKQLRPDPVAHRRREERRYEVSEDMSQALFCAREPVRSVNRMEERFVEKKKEPTRPTHDSPARDNQGDMFIDFSQGVGNGSKNNVSVIDLMDSPTRREPEYNAASDNITDDSMTDEEVYNLQKKRIADRIKSANNGGSGVERPANDEHSEQEPSPTTHRELINPLDDTLGGDNPDALGYSAF